MNKIKNISTLITLLMFIHLAKGQDLSFGLIANDMENHPMQLIDKPNYLETITDPSFGTTIRRITNADTGNIIVPLYSTIQAWNDDETYMIVFDVTNDEYQLLNGLDYSFIRILDDINPTDNEEIFWSHTNADVFFYIDNATYELIKYHVSTQMKDIVVNLATLAGTGTFVTSGNGVMMQSWDDDIWGFRTSTNPNNIYAYSISENSLIQFTLGGDTLPENYSAPMPGPSGETFFHYGNIYDENGDFNGELNLDENDSHASIGKMSNGNDAFFSIQFEEGEFGGCQGTIVAHDMTDASVCYPIIGYGSGYPYPLSGTHLSAIAHNNTEGGWVVASMIGFDQDGQSILDQEIVIAKANQSDIKVYRIAHHRSDENEFDYYGEPHVSISPSGTRVIFASDWSGTEDGQSIDCYVVELPSFYQSLGFNENNFNIQHRLFPNPLTEKSTLVFGNKSTENFTFNLFNIKGELMRERKNIISDNIEISKGNLSSGIYFYQLISKTHLLNGKLIIE